MVQQGIPLRKQLGALGALKHVHLLIGQMSVKVGVQQGLVCKNRVAHDALIDQPVKEESLGQDTERNTASESVNIQTLCAAFTSVVLQ